MVAVRGFMWLDYVVFGSTLLLSLSVGVYHACTGGKQRTTSEYLMADRQLKPLPVAMSIFMSFTSAVLILGFTAEVYVYGIQGWVSCISEGLAVMLSAYMFIPLMHPLKITSIHEYVYIRYDSQALRRITALGNMLLQLVFMGLGMYTPATALEAVTGFPMWASVICTGVIGTIYTTMGGMRAVIWTDVIQSVIMFAGLVAVLVTGISTVGGLSEVWNTGVEGGRIFLNFDTNPTLRVTFWSASFGSAISRFSSVASYQMAVQRYCALPSITHARMAMIFQIPLDIFATTVVALVGLTIYAYYRKLGCDPIRSELITSSNQLVPYYIIDVLGYPGFPGLFVAVIFSAALSSVSSSLNTLSALAWKDLIADKAVYIKSERHRAYITKIFVFSFGCIGCGLSFVMPHITGHVMQVIYFIIYLGTVLTLKISASVIGSMGGAQTGIILLGTLFYCSNWKGGIAGYLIGMSTGVFIMIGQNLTEPHQEVLPTVTDNCTLANNATLLEIPTNPKGIFWLFRISYLYFNTIGAITTVSVGLLISFITGFRKQSDVDPRLVVDYGKRCCFCLSKKDQAIICYCVANKEVHDETQNDTMFPLTAKNTRE